MTHLCSKCCHQHLLCRWQVWEWRHQDNNQWCHGCGRGNQWVSTTPVQRCDGTCLSNIQWGLWHRWAFYIWHLTKQENQFQTLKITIICRHQNLSDFIIGQYAFSSSIVLYMPTNKAVRNFVLLLLTVLPAWLLLNRKICTHSLWPCTC